MKQQVITSLQQAIDSLPHPSIKDLASAPVTKMTEHDFITRQELTTQKSFYHVKRIAIALCCLCLFVIVAKNFIRMGSHTPYSFLTLDVNPGFEILLDKKNTILSIQGVNEEAKALLKDSSYEGSNVMDSVNDLMLRLVNANYLTVNHNTILLTVQCPDEAFLQELESNLATTIQSTLQKENISPNLVIQKKTEKLPTSLPNNEITKGKQYFIDAILSKYPNLSEEKLGFLSLDELLTLLASGSLPAVSDKVITPTSPDDNENSDNMDDIFDDKDEKEDDKEFEDQEIDDDLEDFESEEELDADTEDEDDLDSEEEEDSDNEEDSLEDNDSEDSLDTDKFDEDKNATDETDDSEDSESNTLEDTDQEDSDSNEDTSIETNTGIQDASDDDNENDKDTDTSDDTEDTSTDDSDDDTDTDTDLSEEVEPNSSDSP